MPNHAIAKTILCIHEDESVLTYQRELLEKRGYVVLTAASCWQAAKVPAVRGVAAAIAGFNMPEMDNHEVATEIRRLAPQILLIIVSSDKKMPEHVLRVVDAFVSEDEAHSTLSTVITRVCNGHFACLPEKARSPVVALKDFRETSRPSGERPPR
jgi:CheY-like chemotaxis protein